MIWFTSDWHLGHKNIISYCSRPFNSIWEMNEEIIKRWNSQVSPEDIGYILGDFSLGLWAVDQFVHRLNGELHLIVGNHDMCHPRRKAKAETLLPHYLEAGFKEIKVSDTLYIGNHEVTLSHFPYFDSEAKSLKYPQYRPEDKGNQLHLHGHSHTRDNPLRKTKKGSLQLDVGVDGHSFYPWSLEEIRELFNV